MDVDQMGWLGDVLISLNDLVVGELVLEVELAQVVEIPGRC